MLNIKNKQPSKLEVTLQQWFRDVAHHARLSNVVCVVIPEGCSPSLEILMGKFYPSVKSYVECGYIYIKNIVDLSVEDLDNQIVEVQNVQHLHDLKVYSMEVVS